MKRGQIAGQIFIYVLGIIVVGILLLLGFNAIQKLEQNKCTVQETQFVTDLSGALEKNKGWGISRVESFTLPCDATQVCFVSRDSVSEHHLIMTTEVEPDIVGRYGSIVESVASGDEVNVFTKTATGYNRVSRFEVSAPIELKPEDPVRCFPEDGKDPGSKVDIRFKGLGMTVEVRNAGSN